MSSFSILSVYLSGASLILLLSSVSEAQYYDYTPAPDYDDYSPTFEYSFYSNTSSDDLDKFTEPFIDEEEEEEEDTGGQWEEEDMTVTMATTADAATTTATATTATMSTAQRTTEQGAVNPHNAASLPVSLEIRTLVWTLMILIRLNMQQL